MPGALEKELLVQADRLVGGSNAVLVIDDTAIAKKGTHSVGVAAQYASALGKTANCQTLVSLTLARGEVPVILTLRLFLRQLLDVLLSNPTPSFHLFPSAALRGQRPFLFPKRPRNPNVHQDDQHRLKSAGCKAGRISLDIDELH
jgi:hypothetical protein